MPITQTVNELKNSVEHLKSQIINQQNEILSLQKLKDEISNSTVLLRLQKQYDEATSEAAKLQTEKKTLLKEMELLQMELSRRSSLEIENFELKSKLNTLEAKNFELQRQSQSKSHLYENIIYGKCKIDLEDEISELKKQIKSLQSNLKTQLAIDENQTTKIVEPKVLQNQVSEETISLPLPSFNSIYSPPKSETSITKRVSISKKNDFNRKIGRIYGHKKSFHKKSEKLKCKDKKFITHPAIVAEMLRENQTIDYSRIFNENLILEMVKKNKSFPKVTNILIDVAEESDEQNSIPKFNVYLYGRRKGASKESLQNNPNIKYSAAAMKLKDSNSATLEQSNVKDNNEKPPVEVQTSFKTSSKLKLLNGLINSISERRLQDKKSSDEKDSSFLSKRIFNPPSSENLTENNLKRQHSSLGVNKNSVSKQSLNLVSKQSLSSVSKQSLSSVSKQSLSSVSKQSLNSVENKSMLELCQKKKRLLRTFSDDLVKLEKRFCKETNQIEKDFFQRCSVNVVNTNTSNIEQIKYTTSSQELNNNDENFNGNNEIESKIFELFKNQENGILKCKTDNDSILSELSYESIRPCSTTSSTRSVAENNSDNRIIKEKNNSHQDTNFKHFFSKSPCSNNQDITDNNIKNKNTLSSVINCSCFASKTLINKKSIHSVIGINNGDDGKTKTDYSNYQSSIKKTSTVVTGIQSEISLAKIFRKK